MQFRVDVNQSGTTWQVEVTDLLKGQFLEDSEGVPFKRILECVGEDLYAFPQPPHDEAQFIPDTPDNPHRELCITKDPQVIRAVYEKYLQRQGKDVVKFGRYLFATLLGDASWKAINDAAEKEPIQLSLSWKDENLINRLPWEMMHNGQRFLAEEPKVAITRRVAGTTQTLQDMTTVRVLFVIGSALNEDVIKPGAEYLGLLRSLTHGAKCRLKTHLLLEANPHRIRKAVSWFGPTVVHFICHGYADNNQETFLVLRSDEGGGEQMVRAEDLLKMLQPDPKNPLPPVVILNACYTASQNPFLYTKSGQAASPIAAKLVAGDGVNPGVPIVVGMAGEIADQACRLFTRCFYQAVLEGKEVATAAADGRRVGIIDKGLTDPKSSIDWALPTVFMSAGIEKAEIVVKDNAEEKDWYDVALEFAPSDYPVFCDRLALFEWYDCLMATSPDDLPTPQKHNGDLQLLAIALREKDAKYQDDKLGLTWLLRQFASNAALDGHLPVLNSTVFIQREKSDYPKDYLRLVEDFRRAMNRTAQLFTLNFTPDYLNLLRNVTEHLNSGKTLEQLPADLKQRLEDLPTDMQNAYSEDRSWDGALAQFTALRFDLLNLLTARWKKLEAAGLSAEKNKRPKLLLLVDDVHQMGKATRHLLDTFFSSTYGLRSTAALSPDGPNAKHDIRVVCVYDVLLGLSEEPTIRSWLETAKGVREVPFGAFRQPEDRLAYEFFLSRWRDLDGNDMPLAVNHLTAPKFINAFFKKLSDHVRGIPERLKSEGANVWISGNLDMPDEAQPLRPINDEDRLRLIADMKRN